MRHRDTFRCYVLQTLPMHKSDWFEYPPPCWPGLTSLRESETASTRQGDSLSPSPPGSCCPEALM